MKSSKTMPPMKTPPALYRIRAPQQGLQHGRLQAVVVVVVLQPEVVEVLVISLGFDEELVDRFVERVQYRLPGGLRRAFFAKNVLRNCASSCRRASAMIMVSMFPLNLMKLCGPLQLVPA
mmetsp:Transcript_54715/g.158339  ORF Transcript_54715/g.158339 Transcript_54715/m.158339 type:complete len:120 (-) Transcript_54715:266-625(-)